MRHTFSPSPHILCENSAKGGPYALCSHISVTKSLTHVAGKNRPHTTIERLPDETLLEIFDFYRLGVVVSKRDGPPWKWHRLAQVCQRWRIVISMSPRRLDLQILCKSGTSIERILASWRTLPLVVRFKGPKAKSLPKNVAIALCHPDRVREIGLGLTSATVGSIVDAIKKPFPALECIQITIKDATGPSLLLRDGFLGGAAPRLRKIVLDGINFPFPEIKRVISSTNNLVELNLSRISKSGYFSADALVAALSTSAHLRQLQVCFHYPASLPTQSTASLPPHQRRKRTTFPSLWYLRFHGASEYLEDLVSRVDFPTLDCIKIELYNQIFFEIPQFCRSIAPLNAFKSLSKVKILLTTELVVMYFRQKGTRGINLKYGYCYLSTVCERLDWRLSFVTQVSSQLSLLLGSVDTLSVESSQDNEKPSGEDVDSTQWLELFQPFTHVAELRVSGQLIPGIVQALVTEDMATEVLPKLSQLFLEGVHTPAVMEAAEQFVAKRKLSGRTVHLST
jgi:hypothetical protein